MNRIRFPQFATWMLNDRIMITGRSNGDNVFWGAKRTHWTERNVFLLGHKFDVLTIWKNPDGIGSDGWDFPPSDPNCAGEWNPNFVELPNEPFDFDEVNGVYLWSERFIDASELRDAVDWWGGREPRYYDQLGVSSVPDGVDVRRFVDKNGVNLLVVDNSNLQPNLCVTFLGTTHAISACALSIIEVNGSSVTHHTISPCAAPSWNCPP